jgi:hypothetical protein
MTRMIGIELIRNMFRKGVTSEDFRKKMSEIDREKRELRYDQRQLERRRNEAFERTRRARMRADTSEVIYHLNELKGLDTENRLLLRDLSRLNKALILMGHYARRLERLERGRDSTRLATFIERFRGSRAMAGIEEAEINEQMLQDILDEELGELDRELGMDMGDFNRMDDRTRELLDAVDQVIEAERLGDEETARKVRQRLELVDEREAREDEADLPPMPELEADAAGGAKARQPAPPTSSAAAPPPGDAPPPAKKPSAP